MTTPVYICTGFLDSGKTTFIKDTLMKQDWIEDGPTLLLLCEEGEEEFSEAYLDENGMFCIEIAEEEQLNPDFLVNCEKIYHPSQVIIEYNGTWDLQSLLEDIYPDNWEISGVYSTVSGETLDMYLLNMRNMLMNQLIESELIIINRCGEQTDCSSFRKALKVQNPQAQLIFENVEGEIIPQTEVLPYDLSKDMIEIDDVDFGTWYVDAYEHPEHYEGKVLTFLAQVFRPKKMPEDMMIPGRQIMTCCADDIQFYGYPCQMMDKIQIEQRSWMRVKVRFELEFLSPRAPKQPVLYLLSMEKAEAPEDPVVYL